MPSVVLLENADCRCTKLCHCCRKSGERWRMRIPSILSTVWHWIYEFGQHSCSQKEFSLVAKSLSNGRQSFSSSWSVQVIRKRLNSFNASSFKLLKFLFQLVHTTRFDSMAAPHVQSLAGFVVHSYQSGRARSSSPSTLQRRLGPDAANCFTGTTHDWPILPDV